MREKNKNSWRSGLVALALGGASLFAGNFVNTDVEPGKMYIKSELPRKTLVSGSERIYKMNVVADSTGIPLVKINSCVWKVSNNLSYVRNLTSQKPSETNPSGSNGAPNTRGRNGKRTVCGGFS